MATKYTIPDVITCPFCSGNAHARGMPGTYGRPLEWVCKTCKARIMLSNKTQVQEYLDAQNKPKHDKSYSEASV